MWISPDHSHCCSKVSSLYGLHLYSVKWEVLLEDDFYFNIGQLSHFLEMSLSILQVYWLRQCLNILIKLRWDDKKKQAAET